MSWFGEPQTDKQLTFNLMSQLDIRRAEVEFHGGNDEGFIEGITVYRGERMIEGDLPYSYSDSKGAPEARLGYWLARPVFDKYDSFAGEFYVSGKVVWVLADKSVKMNAQEEVSTWEDFEEEL